MISFTIIIRRRLLTIATAISFLTVFFSGAAIANSDQRIISTDAGVTDIIMALKSNEQLVGIDVTSQQPGNTEVARVGYHRTLSAEGLLSLNPTMVIGSEHMGPPETLTAIKNANITLLQLPSAHDVETLKNNILTIGKALNKSQQAENLLQIINTRTQQIQQQLLHKKSIAFLLQMNSRGLKLAGLNTVGNDVIQLLGGDNLGTHKGYQAISAEALLELQPDIIIIASEDSSNSSADSLLKNNPLLIHTPAGKNHQIVSINGRFLVAGISIKSLKALATISQTLQH